MKRSILLAALLAVGCNTAYAQPRRAPHPARPDAGTGHAGAAADASAGPAAPASRANVLPLSPRGTVGGTWEPRCTASRGCPATPAIPRCAPGTAARSFADVIDQRLALAGQTVAVRAALVASGGGTEMACPPGSCCNRAWGAVYLSGAADSSLRTIALDADREHPGPRFACTGDDSGMCCGTDARGQQVVARGVLRPVPNGGGGYYLEAPTLCTL